MSARMLRRFLEEQEGKKRTDDVEEDKEGESEELESSQPSSSGNPFLLLNDQEEEDEEASYDVSVQDIPEPVIASQRPSKLRSSASHKSKKKKKQTRASEKADKDSIDHLLKDLSIADSTSESSSQGVGKSNVTDVGDDFAALKDSKPSILNLDPKFLKAENELKRIFGSKVVKSFENNSSAAGSRQRQGSRRGKHVSRRTVLITPSDHWPRWDGSLSMEMIEIKGGEQFFRYEYSSSYGHVQEVFETARSTHDLNAIASILAHHPYHIESLLTLAEVWKFSGEHQLSTDAVGRCLYALECAWHPLFNPLHDICRLKYTHDSNKLFFTVLFNHMKNLDRRGCHRSALEVCKLLISLDHDDPMGALFCVDYYSLRAQEYGWLEAFATDFKNDNSIWLFPNFSFSLAISRFYLEHEQKNEENNDTVDKATSDDLMYQALMLHPLVLKKLVDKAPIKDMEYQKILKHKYFSSSQAGSPSLEHLISIYVERSYIMWRIPDLQKLLKGAALRVIESVDQGKDEAKDWSCVRKEAFSSNRNEFAHLLISDFSDSVPTIPPDELRQFVGDQHLLPGVDNVAPAHDAHGGRAPREILNRNPLVVLLESMLPWVDYGPAEDDPHGPNQHNE